MDVSSLVELKKNRKIPDIAPGDTVKVHAKIIEGDRERIQVFQGVVIKISKGGAGASFTVRHVAQGIGVERTFPMYSTNVDKVEIVRQGKVRRSRLYYLRNLSGKEARRKIKRVDRKLRQVGEELIEAEPEEVLAPEDVLTEEAAIEETTAEAPVEEPKAEETPSEAPAEEAAPAEEEKPAVEEPVAEAPAEEPAAEEPAAEEPAEEAPAAEETAAEVPADEEKKEDA